MWAKLKNEALKNGAPVNIVQQAETLKAAGKENDARALLSPYTGTKTSDTENRAAILKADSAKMGRILSSEVGSDGFVSPEDYKEARSIWVSDGYSSSDFDNRFGGFVNPARAQDYSVKFRSSALSPIEKILQQMVENAASN